MINEKILVSKKVPVLIFVFYLINYVIFDIGFNKRQDLAGATVQYTSGVVVVTAVIYFIKLYKMKADTNLLVFIMIMIGILLRLERGVILRWSIYQHDVNETCGHLDYIMYIVKNGRLPDSNTYQYYHPPLYHLISAFWIKINSLLGINDKEVLSESLQYLSGFYSSLLMLISYQVFKILRFEGKTMLGAMALIVFSPALLILSASINNDQLMILFVFLGILYTLRWYQTPNFKELMLLAVIVGLGMMTKLNMVFLTPCIAVVFAKSVFIDRKVSLKNTWYQFCFFGMISAALGLWYPIRNYIRFNQPFNYIYEFSHNHPAYVGDYSLWKKLFEFPLISRVINEPYCVNGADYNLPTYLIKCSVIGEYWNAGNEKILVFFEIINMLLMLCCIISGIYVVLTVKERIIEKIMFGLYWVIQMTAFIIFYLKYPFSFTMHFRYIIPTVLIGAAFLGLADESLCKKSKAVKCIKIGVRGLIILFCSLSILTSFCII